MSDQRDSADVTADKDIATRAKYADRDRGIQNEIDSTHALSGGRNNPVHTTVPGMDAEDGQHRAMAQHSADFISAQVSGNRAKMETARTGFHAVRAASRGVPKGLEAPCEGSGCVQMAAPTKTSCGRGDCGKSLDKNVSRPRG